MSDETPTTRWERGDTSGFATHFSGLIAAGQKAKLDRFIGYYESYAESHEVLDRDEAMQEEVRNVARAVAESVVQLRRGQLSQPDVALDSPRPK